MIWSSVFNLNPTFTTVKVTSLTPTRVVYVGADESLTDSTNMTFDGTVLYVDSLQLDILGQSYKFTDRGSGLLALQSQSSGVTSLFSLFSKDGDSTDTTIMQIWGRGTPTSLTNFEIMNYGWRNGGWYEIASLSGGTGTLRPLRLYCGAYTTQFVLNVDGSCSFSGAISVTGLSTLTGGALVNSDTNKVSVGAGTDAAFYYDGTNGNIDTDLVAPSDLTIDCGGIGVTAKTLVLEVPVWKDINFGAANYLIPAAGYPDKDEFKDEAGADTGIETLAFGVDEGVSFSFEIQHDYQEGSDLTFHVHWQGITAPAGGTDNVQWRLTYTITRDYQTMNAVTTVDSPDQAITAQYQCVRSNFAIIEGTTGGYDGGFIRIGDQFNCKMSRVAATADEYGGDALLITAGIHYQIDTIGSRQIGTK